MKIEIREEGGCELYRIYIDDLFYEDVGDGVIIDYIKFEFCLCDECPHYCSCKCHV